MIKNYKQYIKESLLNKLQGPNIDELLKNFGGYKKLSLYAANKGNDDILVSIYNKLKSENNNNFNNYENLFYYFLNNNKFYDLSVEIYEKFKSNKEITSVVFNKAVRNYNFKLILSIYKNNTDNQEYVEKIMGIFNNINMSNRNLNEYYFSLIDNLIDVGFNIKFSDINEKLIYLTYKSHKLTDKILELYERRKRKFFIGRFNKEQLDNLNNLLEHCIFNDDIESIKRIFNIDNLKNYNHEETIKIGILRNKIDTLRVIFEHDGEIKKSKYDYLHGAISRNGYLTKVVELLLEFNYPVSETNIKTAIIFFDPNKKDESLRIIDLLFKQYGSVNFDFMREAFHNHKTVIIEYLLDNGYDVHHNGDIPLTWGCMQGNMEMVKIILNHGADPNARNGEIMYHALNYNRENKTYESIEIVRLLLEYGYKFIIPKRIINLHNNSEEIISMIDKYYQNNPFNEK